MSREMDIATTISEQISAGIVTGKGRAISGAQAKWCWGISRLTTRTVNGNMGLSFNVLGLAFKGKVAVVLNSGDEYDIYSYTTGDEDWNPVSHGVQWEELAEVLDIFIEGRK